MMNKVENDMPPHYITGLAAIADYNKYVMPHLRELGGFYSDEKYRYANKNHISPQMRFGSLLSTIKYANFQDCKNMW
jgi:hypothetical protein